MTSLKFAEILNHLSLVENLLLQVETQPHSDCPSDDNIMGPNCVNGEEDLKLIEEISLKVEKINGMWGNVCGDERDSQIRLLQENVALAESQMENLYHMHLGMCEQIDRYRTRMDDSQIHDKCRKAMSKLEEAAQNMEIKRKNEISKVNDCLSGELLKLALEINPLTPLVEHEIITLPEKGLLSKIRHIRQCLSTISTRITDKLAEYETNINKLTNDKQIILEEFNKFYNSANYS